jgi:dihydroxyacetone kinase
LLALVLANFMTSLEGVSFSVALLKLRNEMKDYPEAPYGVAASRRS